MKNVFSFVVTDQMEKHHFFTICAANSREFIKVLNSNEASRLTQTLDENFNSCLHYCSRWNLTSFLALINSKWCTPELFLHVNKSGETALMWAVRYQPKIFDCLVESHWTLEWLKPKDKNGNNLLAWCCMYNPSLVVLLLKHHQITADDFKVTNYHDQRPLELVRDEIDRISIAMASMELELEI